MHGERTRDRIHKLKQGRLQLVVSEKNFPTRKVKQWSRFAREQPTVEQPVSSPFLKVFKIHLENILGHIA